MAGTVRTTPRRAAPADGHPKVARPTSWGLQPAGAGAVAAAPSLSQVPFSARHAFLVLLMSMVPSDCLQWWFWGVPVPLAGAEAGIAAHATVPQARAFSGNWRWRHSLKATD